MTAGRPRRDLLLALCPVTDGLVVDVGADHGLVASAIAARGGRVIATERAPNRIGRRDVPWIVADGLAPLRTVAVAIIAGMGAHTIAGILGRGPRPTVAVVVHATDNPPALRGWLAANGWRIDAEALAREAGRFAEVIRAVPGDEPATGLELAFGPRLLAGDDPLLVEHLRELHAHHAALAAATRHVPHKHAGFSARVAFLAAALVARGIPL
ncbi:MAG: tRNA (adenine(22)-N(1))-methyltransferase TrmK [Myxococcota bacterium]